MGARVFTDLELQETVAVSGSSAVYSTGIDLGADKGGEASNRALADDLSFVLDVTYTSGTFNFTLVGDTALPIDGSSVAIETKAAVTAAGQVVIAIPSDFSYRYVGWSLDAVAHAGSVDSRLSAVAK